MPHLRDALASAAPPWSAIAIEPIEIESFRIKYAAYPPEHVRVFAVRAVRDALEEVLIATRSTHVLRRACILTSRADRRAKISLGLPGGRGLDSVRTGVLLTPAASFRRGKHQRLKIRNRHVRHLPDQEYCDQRPFDVPHTGLLQETCDDGSKSASQSRACDVRSPTAVAQSDPEALGTRSRQAAPVAPCASEDDVAARRDDTRHVIDAREQSLERRRVLGPDLKQHAGVARDAMQAASPPVRALGRVSLNSPRN